MTEYEKLAAAEKVAHTVEIEETATGKIGVANTTAAGKAAVFYGADDGSDDKIITAEEFSRDFRITGIIEK